MPFSADLTEAYFGYGSNLSYDFLKERLKNGDWTDDWHRAGHIEGSIPARIGIYVLPDYEFAYNLDSEDHTETWANVVPQPGAKVYGLVSYLTPRQLAELDRTEDVPIDYQRVALRVYRYVAEAGIPSCEEAPETIDAWVYIGCNKFRFTSEPKLDPAYVSLITEAAENEHLPQEYIDDYLKGPMPAEVHQQAG